MTRSRDVADTQDNLGGAVAPWVGGKNYAINGNFDIWQRGTSFVPVNGSATYCADRWQASHGSITNTALTASRQTAGLAGSQYCIRYARNSGSTATGTMYLTQTLETVNSIPFQGKTATVSFWARAGANYSATSGTLGLNVNSGTGTDENINAGFTGGASFIAVGMTLTTTWQKFTFTGSVPSNATQIGFYFNASVTGTAGAADYFEIAQFQLEIGNVATPFSRAGGSIGGELALCQRYFHRAINAASNSNERLITGNATGTGASENTYRFPVTMRTSPTLAVSSASHFIMINSTGGSAGSPGVVGMGIVSPNMARIDTTGGSGLTAGNATVLQSTGSSSTLDFNAEL